MRIYLLLVITELPACDHQTAAAAAYQTNFPCKSSKNDHNNSDISRSDRFSEVWELKKETTTATVLKLLTGEVNNILLLQ